MSNSAQNKRMTSLHVNESFIQKSIIAQLPQSPSDRENVSQLQSQIGRLRQQLQFYKKESFSKNKTEPFSFRDIQKMTAVTEQTNGNHLNTDIDKLRKQNEQQNLMIKKMSQELRSKKKSEYGVDLTVECQRLEYINQKLQNENTRILTENQQLKKDLIQARQMNKNQLQHRHQANQDRNVEEFKRKIEDQQLKIEELAESALEYVREIDALNLQIEKLRRENVIDRSTRKSTENLRGLERHNAQNSRYSIINMHNSRAFSELDLLDNERFNLKMSQKNKEYEQLYLKYQSIQNELHAAQDINNDLERQRKFLSERLSDIEIHTEGDEIVGELENKLVLMSTQLMRLGHLSRTKAQENKDLNIRLKEFILKRQNLEKDVIERDKLILNYKEELRIIEIRNNDRTIMESRVQKDSQIKEKNGKFAKQIERLTVFVKQKSQSLKNADIKNAILQEKNMRLEKQNEELEKENKQLSTSRDRNKSIHTKVLNLEAEVNYFKEANSGLKDEMKRYESKFYENRSDIEKLTRQKEQTRQTNLELQDKVRSTQEELRRLQVQSDDKSMEIRQVSHKSQEKVMLKTNQIKKLEQKIIILQKEIQRSSRNKSELLKYEELVKQIQRLEGVQLTLKLQINTYEEKIVLLAQENQRLNMIVKTTQQDKILTDKIKYQNQQKDRKIRDLQKDVENSNARERRYKQENENLRQKLRGTYVQERESESWQFKNRQLRDEIDALKTQISVKDEQIKNINERYRKQSSEKYTLLLRNQELNSRLGGNKMQNYGSDTSKDYYEMEIKKLNTQIRLRTQKLEKLEQQVESNDEVYSALSGEVERLNIVLDQRARELTNYKKQVDFLQHKVRTCEQSLRQRTINQISSQKCIVQAESKTKIQICQGKIRNYEGELELMKQRYQNLKKEYGFQQTKLNQALNEKLLIEQKSNEFEYQLSQKSNNFRHVEDSFKLTIFQIKKSNERLEQSMRQIENHYISKLQLKERECEDLRSDKKSLQNEFYELQKKYSNIQQHYGSQIKQKNLYINNLSNNHNQTKEEIAQIKRIKSEYQIKITLLSQEIQRLTEVKDKQKGQIERLNDEMRSTQNKFTSSMKESSAIYQTVDVLSTEIERLNSVLVQNVEKIRDYTKKSNRLEIQNSQLTKDLEIVKFKNNEYEKYMNEYQEGHNDRIDKLQQLNKELKYQLQEKSKDAERFLERMQILQKKEQTESNEYMRTVAEEIKLLRAENQKLQNKLGIITRQNQQLVTQLQYHKRPKSNGESDEKMRIIGNYEATIKHMKEQNSFLNSQIGRAKAEYERINKVSYELQERGKISEEKARVFEEKCRRLDERLKIIEERSRNTEDILKSNNGDKQQVEQKLLSALEEVGRLQIIIKAKQTENEKLLNLISNSKSAQNQDYYENIRDKKGIFVIKQVSQFDERSRSASGNGLQPPIRHPSNHHSSDLQHRYELLETVNKKLSSQCECIRKKNVEYEFKMSKLKEEFDLINRLIHEYREQNDNLKENNRILNQQNHNRANNFIHSHSQFSSPQHSSIKSNSYIENFRPNLSPQNFPQSQPKSHLEANHRDRQDSLIKSKLIEEIDRLNKINNTLQNQIHDLRLSSTDNISLRKRFEQNLSLMVILFTEVQSLRMRVKE